MARFGQGLNPQLSAVDYSPIMQGTQIAAQGIAQGGQNIGNALAGLGQQIGQGIKEYQANKEQRDIYGGLVESKSQRLLSQLPQLQQMGVQVEGFDKLSAQIKEAPKMSLGKLKALNSELDAYMAQAEKTVGLKIQGAQLAQLEADARSQRAIATAFSPGFPAADRSPQSLLGAAASRGASAKDLSLVANAIKDLQPPKQQQGRVVSENEFNSMVARGLDVKGVPQNDGNVLVTQVSPFAAPAPTFGQVPAGGSIQYNRGTGAYEFKQVGPNPDEAKKAESVKNFKDVTQNVIGAFLKLDELGGTIKPDSSFLQNISARVTASDLGQVVAGAFGEEAQTLRNQIEGAKPLILGAIMQSTGMSARALDSNAELKFWLSSLADPKKDMYSQLVALDVLDRRFGDGNTLSEMLADRPDVVKQIRARSSRELAAKPINLKQEDLKKQESEQGQSLQLRPLSPAAQKYLRKG